jgi:hypothetical protein
VGNAPACLAVATKLCADVGSEVQLQMFALADAAAGLQADHGG